MESFKYLITALLVCLALTGQSQADNLIVNGGFETGDFTGWSTVDNSNNGTSWTISTSNPHQGTYSAAIGPYNATGYAATITQYFSDIPGQTYLFSFWLYNSPVVTPLSSSPPPYTPDNGFLGFTSDISQTPIASWLTDVSAFGWTQYNYEFVGSTFGSDFVSFEAWNTTSTFYLDDVSVTPVPEPTTMLLVGSGLLGLAGLWRKFKK